MLTGARKWILIISLLALNIVEQAASAISGAIPQMAQSFPQQSQVQIELVTTVVSVFVTIFVLVSGFISNKIGQKQTAILGLLIASVSSVIPAFATNFTVVMVSRAVLGIGIGLANPLAISLIGEFFEGDTLANLMGWRSAIAGIGVSLMTLAAGYLLQISWHAAYLVYLLFIPTLILFIFFVPEPEKFNLNKEQAESNDLEDEKNGSRLGVVLLAIVLFLFFTLAMVMMVKLATMYVEEKIGKPTQASTVLSILGFAQLIGGALFGTVIIGTASTNGLVIIAAIVSGVCSGMAIPYIFTKVSDLSTTKSAPLNNAIVLVGSNLGSFLAPYTGSFLGASAASAITNAGYLTIGLAILVALYMAIQYRNDTHPKAFHSGN
ncbi:MFS transporter [Ligilactobacillus agilis]|uniref:MFS transporter n=1 Tax=Ligilactobacillus agilis TaxID=1601 RepID=UPI003F8B4676